jgi:sporulation protein YlmC with PRC-barrel domain
MEMRGCGRKVLHLSAFGALVVTLVTALSLPAQARDKSGVLKASEVIGMNVQGTDGKKLGDIKDLVIDPEDGGVQYAVLDFGGFAGIGDKYFAVPWEALQLDKTNKKLSLDIHKKDLKDAPGFDKTNWPDLNLQQVVIYEFYEIPQPDRDHAKR